MSKNIHRDYVESVGHFCQCIPSRLQISTDEVDAYFRACVLCLWACGGRPAGGVAGINQIYTDRQIQFTAQQFNKAISYYQSKPNATVGVPEFFRKLIQADMQDGTGNSRSFAELQKTFLMLCASYDSPFRAPETDRCINILASQLTAACDEAGIPPQKSPAQELNSLLDDVSKVMSRDYLGGVYSDFYPPESPVRPQPEEEKKTEEPSPAGPDTPPAEPEKPNLEDAMAELNELIGLEAVKRDVDSLVNLVKVRALRKERGLKCPEMSFHLVFSGNPGTGKTTVARIVGRIYHALGILSKGHLVEVDRSGLVAGYVGQTAIKTQEVISQAMGGVLFIDEAYSLIPENADKDFGQEAVDTILKAMEDYRDDFVVIAAGYATLMPRFIDSNPGLKSRFNKYLYFEDYNGEQLYEIFRGRVERNDYQLDSEAAEAVKEHLQELYEDRDQNFGNARDVRNLFEKIVANQADRVAALEEPSDEDIRTIAVEDLKGLMDLSLETAETDSDTVDSFS